MTAGKLLADAILTDRVEARDEPLDHVVAEAERVLATNHVCLVRGFPVAPDRYLEFLGRLGEPLPNYSSRSELAKDDPHPQINRVKYKRKSDHAGKHSVHYVAGGLRPHSARSWCAPRPRFFAMLMVEPGWRDAAPGQRGESVVVRWRDLFVQLAERDGGEFEDHFERLARTPVTFQADNVRETLCDSPVFYPLSNSVDRYDLGVRLKQDLAAKILDLRDQIPEFARYQRSLDYFLDASADEQYQAGFPMERGDVLLLDNNRTAHGRREIVGERLVGGEVRTNNREIWSVTVA